MSDRLLTAEELKRLTGATRYSAQRRELERRKIRFIAARNGEPLVRLSALDAEGKPAHRGDHRWNLIGASIRQLRP